MTKHTEVRKNVHTGIFVKKATTELEVKQITETMASPATCKEMQYDKCHIIYLAKSDKNYLLHNPRKMKVVPMMVKKAKQ